jgi:hypothetical protein
VRRAARRPVRHLDRPRDDRGVHAPARTGLRALGRIVEGRRAGGRPLRPGARAGLLRRVHVLARDGCLEGRPGPAGAAPGGRGLQGDRLPAGHGAPGLPGSPGNPPEPLFAIAPGAGARWTPDNRPSGATPDP